MNENIFFRLEVTCDNAHFGCPTVTKLDLLPHHLKECEFNPKKPVVCEQGCGLAVPKDELKDHNCIKELRQELENVFENLVQEEKLSLTIKELHFIEKNTRLVFVLAHLGKNHQPLLTKRVFLLQYTNSHVLSFSRMLISGHESRMTEMTADLNDCKYQLAEQRREINLLKDMVIRGSIGRLSISTDGYDIIVGSRDFFRL